MKILVTAIFFHICYSFGHQSCFENGKDYPGFDIYQNGIYTSDADQCQKLCQNTSSCEYWTWLLDYDGKDGLCYLKYSKEQVVNENKAISGPKYCTTSTTPITSITTTTITTSTATSSCFQWEIEYLDYRFYWQGIKSPEECQWQCNNNHLSATKCEYWTWISDQDPNCQDLYQAGRCHIIEHYPEAIVANRCAVSGPKNCSYPQPTTSTTISTTHSSSTSSTSYPWTPSNDDEG